MAHTRRFLFVDLARRVLTDPDTRQRYDAVLALQDLITRPRTDDRLQVERVTTDATDAVAGWRCPTELQHAVAEVVDDAVRWLEEPRWAGTGQASRPSDRRRSGSWQAPDADLRDEMRRMAEELRVQWIERVVDLMQRWPAFVDGVVSASALGERRSWLRCCYDVYVALRDMQKDLRVAGRVRSDDEARLYLHTCRALVDVADFIRAVQTPLGRSTR